MPWKPIMREKLDGTKRVVKMVKQEAEQLAREYDEVYGGRKARIVLDEDGRNYRIEVFRS